ncbi:MAG TPA: serine/threonine-protein kinase [Polyangiaceae bacterium]
MGDKFEYESGDVLVGKRGSYRVQKPLGAGGMGACYLVEDTDAPRSYVLKTMHSSLAAKKEGLAAFDLEARGVIALHACPNIVAAYQIDKARNGVPFYLMEVLSGRSLRQAITGHDKRSLRMDPDTACGIGIGIANALVFAHGKQVTHCDLKPDNIFLVQSAQGNAVKLLDFGAMKATLVRAGYQGSAGTPAYMAPEQLRREDVDARADLYAFGLILYEMIAGTHPFKSFGLGLKGAAERIDRLPLPLEQLGLGIPDDVVHVLDGLIFKLLRPRVDERCSDASYILVKLTEAKRIIASGTKKRNVHAATTNPADPSPELMAHLTGAVDEATVAPGTDPDIAVARSNDDSNRELPYGSTVPSPALRRAAPVVEPKPGEVSTLPPSKSVPSAEPNGVAYVDRAPDTFSERQALEESRRKRRVADDIDSGSRRPAPKKGKGFSSWYFSQPMWFHLLVGGLLALPVLAYIVWSSHAKSAARAEPLPQTTPAK